MMDLLEWAKKNGTDVGDVSIDFSPKSGYLLQASKDIAPDSSIISCSYQTMLSYLNVALGTTKSEQPFPMSFDGVEAAEPHIIGHFFLIQQYILQEKSFWYFYIKLLPQPNECEKFGIPILWPEEDQRFLAGTNLEPAMKSRAEMWKKDWEGGISQIKDPEEKIKYSYELYQWAASIFGSRSFRASLTVSEDQINNSNLLPKDKELLLEYVKVDKFSVLLPVLDLGNHNGANEVYWHHETAKQAFTFSNSNSIAKGSEVFNYYGDKSNSELLVAYGFTLPNAKYDVVNLRVTPSPTAQSLRRTQACHRIPKAGQEEEEFMYQVRLISPNHDTGRLLAIRHFSHGLVDTAACMVATPREQIYLAAPTHSCSESRISESQVHFARNTIQVFFVLKAKLESEIARLDTSASSLGSPQNRNQETAIDFRHSQRRILEEALKPITELLVEELTKPLSATITSTGYYFITNLERAYDSLRTHYEPIWAVIMQIIADDQEEELPLNWSALVVDWDHTYWIVWTFLLLVLRENDRDGFARQNSVWDQWVSNMEFNHANTSTMYACPSEYDTIDDMALKILRLSQFESIRKRWSSKQYVQNKNFASYVVMESGILGAVLDIPQELLCINIASF